MPNQSHTPSNIDLHSWFGALTQFSEGRFEPYDRILIVSLFVSHTAKSPLCHRNSVRTLDFLLPLQGSKETRLRRFKSALAKLDVAKRFVEFGGPSHGASV